MFPKADLVDTKVVDDQILGKSFMPGGTMAHYKRGTVEFDEFVAKTSEAALLLPDWNKALAGSKLVPSFGGYFGKDGDRPVFVFAKGNWIVGIVGLNEQDADTQARVLATRVD